MTSIKWLEVPVNRLLKYLNLLLAVGLVAVLVVIYWFAYRVLPKTSGRINAPVSQRVVVKRDSLGVPHIEAANLQDALFVQGYVTAQDRLWQLDAMRRFGSGTLSEIIGSTTVELDKETRRLRMRRLAEEHAKTLPEATHAQFAAFARGVNYFIETHRDSLPVEFTLLKYDPAPWSEIDSIVIGMHMYRTLTTSWDEELHKRNMLKAGDPDKVNLLYAQRSGREVLAGSNAWVISGKRTTTGKPILANDPHLEFSNPSTWYMIHVRCPEMDVTGVSLPGLPGVIIGHNDRIAWGVTNLQFDVQDLYSEKINQQTGQYLYKGQVLQARAETDVINVKGKSPVTFQNLITRHGPLITDQGGEYFALRWTAADPGSFRFPFLAIDAAHNWDDFENALRQYPGPAQNFVYADVDGNIGYQAAGNLPVRHNWQGDVPVDGSSGEYEWDGYVPFDQLPRVYNPPSGVIVTANQNPFPPDAGYTVHGNFAPGYRDRQIYTLLTSHSRWSVDNMLAIQKDVYSPLYKFVAQQTVAAYDRRHTHNPTLDPAVDELRRWNGQMEKGTAAPLIATMVYQQLRTALAEKAAPGKSNEYDSIMAGPAIERVLRERPSTWFSDYDQLLLRALLDGIEAGRRIQGRNVDGWNYGAYLQVTIESPVLHGAAVQAWMPWLNRYFDIGPVQMSGSSSSVKQTTRRLGPSMRMGVDLADLDRSYMNVTIGQSGQFLSSHYRDQWDSYYVGHSFPMKYRNVSGNVLVFAPQ